MYLAPGAMVAPSPGAKRAWPAEGAHGVREAAYSWMMEYNEQCDHNSPLAI